MAAVLILGNGKKKLFSLVHFQLNNGPRTNKRKLLIDGCSHFVQFYSLLGKTPWESWSLEWKAGHSFSIKSNCCWSMNAICNRREDAKDVPHSGTSATATGERHLEHMCAVLKKDPSKIWTVNVVEGSIPAACFTFSLTTLEVKGLYKVNSTHAEWRLAYRTCAVGYCTFSSVKEHGCHIPFSHFDSG